MNRIIVLACLALAFERPSVAASATPVATFSHFRYVGRQPVHRRIALGPDEYRNPIIEGSYSDPSIVRVGRNYFLANASFTLFPGEPIFRSRDLVHWRQIASAIDRPGMLNFGGLDTWQGVYAPNLRYHAGRFYLLSACASCGGIYIQSATHAGGPWSNPKFLGLDGIDPSIMFDDNGPTYLLSNGAPVETPLYDGHRAIWMQEIDLETLALVGPRRVIVDGGDGQARKPFWIEGPHLFKRDGWYILICAQGGTKENHTEVAFRSRSAWGPYAAAPGNPILSQLGLDPARPDPVVQTGHADFVQTAAGDWWAVFLGSRPWGPRETDYNTGRETFLLPVSWHDDWPSILPAGEAVPYALHRPKLPAVPLGEVHAGDFAVTDDFTSTRLQSHWATLGWHGSAPYRVRKGALELHARSSGLGTSAQPALVAIRQQHMDAGARVTLRFVPRFPGDRAGLTAYQGSGRFLALSVAGASAGGRELRLERMAGQADIAASSGVGALVASTPLSGSASTPVQLRVDAKGRAYRFDYKTSKAGWRNLGGDQDGAVLSTSQASGFTGVLLGLFTTSLNAPKPAD